MKETTALTIVGASIMLMIFGSALVSEKYQQECKLEAMKALVEPSRIKEICG